MVIFHSKMKTYNKYILETHITHDCIVLYLAIASHPWVNNTFHRVIISKNFSTKQSKSKI